MLICTVEDDPASAALIAALVSSSQDELAITAWPGALRRLARACARRGLAVELGAETIEVGGRTLVRASPGDRAELSSRPGDRAEIVRLQEQRVALELDGTVRLGERAELLAVAPLLEALDRGAGLRWALLTLIEGSDGFISRVDLSERRPDAALDAGLQRCFPSLVGRVGFCSAIGPQPGAALHLSVLLGTGATIDGVRDLLAAQAEGRSRWPKLSMRPGFGSADSLGDPGVLLDLDAITNVGPLLRLVAYYDPWAVLAGDLLRRLEMP